MTHTPTSIAPAGDDRNGSDGTPARLYRFPNGYGLSVTSDPMGRYGWSMAVVRYFDLGDGFVTTWDDSGTLLTLDYSTPVTADVVRLNGPDDPEIEKALTTIEALDPANARHRTWDRWAQDEEN